MASGDVFSIDIEGRGGHAALPHLTRDPVPVAAELVLAIQSLVARRVNAFDPAIVSVTRLRAGTTSNVIPEGANLQGTIRAVSDATRRRVRAKLEALVAGLAAAHEVEIRLHVLPGYPVTVNDAGFAGFASRVASELLGEERTVAMPSPVMGAEDFSYILERVPGALAFLGARLEGEGGGAPLHSNRMVLDERVMATGMALHAGVALRFLGGDAGPGGSSG